MELALEVGAKKLVTYSDSQSIVEQVNGNYEAKDLNIMKYLKKIK